jgi:hypothetical protein
MDFSLKLGEEVLSQTPVALHAMLSNLSEDWIAGGEEHDAWSPHQVVEHLTYIEQCDWIDRVRLILEHGEERILQPVEGEAGSPASGTGSFPIFCIDSPPCGRPMSRRSTRWSRPET